VFAGGLGACWPPWPRAGAVWVVRELPVTKVLKRVSQQLYGRWLEAPSGVPVMPPTTAPPVPVLARLRTWLARALAAAALAVPCGFFTPPAVAAPDPAPDPAPHVRPDPAVANGAAAPTRPPAVEQQATPAPARQAPAPQRPVQRQPSVSTWTPPPTASAARSDTTDRADAARTRRSGQARHERRAPTVVALPAPAMPSGPLLVRGPSSGSSGGDRDESALILAGLALLLLVGASASLLHATTFGSDDPRRIRPT
jgi:hypothetical protein